MRWRLLVRHAGMALWIVLGVCCLGIVVEGVEYGRQVAAQRGIDAHPAEVSATVAGYRPSKRFEPARYELTYEHRRREYRSVLNEVPGEPGVGTRVCLEVDSTEPGNARPCGTRGGLARSTTSLWIGAVALTVTALLIFVRGRMMRRWRPVDTVGPTTAGDSAPRGA